MELAIRPIDDLQGGVLRLPLPVLHPFALEACAAQVGQPVEVVEAVWFGNASVAVREDEVAWAEPGAAPGLTGSAGLRAALDAAGGLGGRGSWPFLHALPVPDEAFRRRFQGLSYLYARVDQAARFLRRIALAELPAGPVSNLERAVEALFMNGQRGRLWTCRPLDHEGPTLNGGDPAIAGDVACTSLGDVVRVHLPGLDVAAAFRSPEPVTWRAPDDADPLVVMEALRAVGLRA